MCMNAGTCPEQCLVYMVDTHCQPAEGTNKRITKRMLRWKRRSTKGRGNTPGHKGARKPEPGRQRLWVREIEDGKDGGGGKGIAAERL